MTLIDRIEAAVKDVPGGLTMRQLSRKLKVSMQEISDEAHSDYRFNVNVAIGLPAGYAELDLRDHTVEIMPVL